MKAIATTLPDVWILEPRLFQDDRGFFFESFNQRTFAEILHQSPVFVQDNHSRSVQGTLRGLHYQLEQTQGKLVRVVVGEIYDVAVDLRKSSPTFGQWCGTHLDSTSHRQLWVPPGFAHGFYVTSPVAEVLYKTTDFYHPASERTLLWNDPALGIDWPVTGAPILSPKDGAGMPLAQAEVLP